MKPNNSTAISDAMLHKTGSFGAWGVVRALAVGLFAYVLASLNNENLPDYDAYLLLYTISGQLEGRYEGFGQVIDAFKNLGSTYEQFRMIVLVLGVVLSILLLNFNIEGIQNLDKFRHNSRRSLVLLFLIFIFIFEFFVVRLRAGISIFFFSLGFLPLLNGYRFLGRNAFRSMAILLCFMASAAVHFETFGVLLAFLLPPLLWKRTAEGRGYGKSTRYALICLLMWVILLSQVVSGSTNVRGQHLASDLNIFRLLAISFLPILIWIPARVYYKKISSHERARIDYPYFFSLNYTACAIAIISVYYLDLMESDGEALVRVVTLSSVGAAISISGWGINRRNLMPIYLLSSNSIFFINTVFFIQL